MSATVENECAEGREFDPGICRCCGEMRKCRLLNEEYQYNGSKEVYADMIMKCFVLLISNPDGYLICLTCVKRLRDCLAFRKQCEEAFPQMQMYDARLKDREESAKAAELLAKRPGVKIIKLIKPAPGSSLCMDVDDRQYDDEDMPLDQLAKVNVVPKKICDLKAPIKVEMFPSKAPPAPIKFKKDPLQKAKAPIKVTMTPIKVKMTPEIKQAGVIEMVVKDDCLRFTLTEPSNKNRISKEQEMTETNIVTVVEYSFVCPFKSFHGNTLLCYYCGDHFYDPSLLREHTEVVHSPKNFKITEYKKMTKVDVTRVDCRLCPEKIDSLEEFKKHVSTVHDKKYYFECRDPILPFKLLKDEAKCALCETTFPYFHALNKHMNEHYSNYTCETCGVGFVNSAKLLIHQQSHEQGGFPCPTCGKVFKEPYNRDLHVDRVHKKVGRVHCPKCDVRLMTHAQKMKHLVEVHGEAPLSLPCNMCERVFDSRVNLTIHRKKAHLKDFRYECQYCFKKFFGRWQLNNHIPTHTGEKNFKCKFCDKCYPRLKTLQDHVMKIHTNDRSSRCHICGKAFRQNSSLKAHIKSQHPELE